MTEEQPDPHLRAGRTELRLRPRAPAPAQTTGPEQPVPNPRRQVLAPPPSEATLARLHKLREDAAKRAEKKRQRDAAKRAEARAAKMPFSDSLEPAGGPPLISAGDAA